MPEKFLFTSPSLPISHPVLIVAIAMGIFLFAPLLLQRMRIPGLIGIIIAGAVVGPNALNLLERDQTIVLLGTVGLLYLMFMAGVEIDLHGFKRHRNRSLLFGILTFTVPMSLGYGVGLMLGYGTASSILLASMFASHTLVSFPIASRYGISKNQAVTMAVGGTIITDTAALLVLAVVAASTRGALDAAFWIRLVVLLSIYVVLIWVGLPRAGRWFFRNRNVGQLSEYFFILTALFGGAYLAEVAGIEPIVGAFLVGLALNRLIPETGLLNNRIHFVGEAIFIPFFLLSIGMLVDLRILAGDLRAWKVMAGMTITVCVTKWIAAKAAERLCGFSPAEGWTVFGLSVPQAAATLAATLIGIEVGLFDEAVLNGAIMMILTTCIIGPWVVEKYGREVALQEERKTYTPEHAPQRILVPMANPATAGALMDLALVLREPDSPEPVYPLTVVPSDEEGESKFVEMAEKMLSHAVAYASGANVPVVPLTRVDHNFADGIARGITETRTSTVIIGWDGKSSSRRGIFGSVLDQVLEQTRQMLLVARLGHPLNTTERIILLVPEGADRIPGFLEAVHAVKQMANRLSAVILGFSVGEQSHVYQSYLDNTAPDAPSTFEHAPDYHEVLRRLRLKLRPDDLVIVLGARRGSVAWNQAFDQLPHNLANLVPESFIMLYPAEASPTAPPPTRVAMPRSLSPARTVFDIPSEPFHKVLNTLLATEFASAPLRLRRIEGALIESITTFAAEVRPGVIVPHVRIPDLLHSITFLGVSPAGVIFPHASSPSHLIFLVLSPSDQPSEHLTQLAEIAHFVSTPGRYESLCKAESVADLGKLK
jgi:Kef-type K+ transport system membrane component KefB/nucleotide-binding universal stress UspA family protein